ncbi:hypothetical protein B0H14DRAFT_3562500 [Mycena olivaceomarginata]|nr:hypothetical protein B0H14DRAFT_3562500 [Mycena olivaceomarginata]
MRLVPAALSRLRRLPHVHVTPGLAGPVAARAHSRASSCLRCACHCRRPRSACCPLAYAPLRVRCCPVRYPALNSGTAFPKELQTYLHDYNVLLLNVCNHADLDKAQSFVLSRLFSGGWGAAPTNETTMFKNRDKLDLIVVYDQSSQTLGGPNTPMSVLVRLISETVFTKLLKRMPMALVGGFDAWRREMGEQGTGAAKAPSPAPISFTLSTGSSSSSSAAAAAPMSNGYSSVNGANGVNGAAPMVNGFSSSSSSSSSTSMTNGFAGFGVDVVVVVGHAASAVDAPLESGLPTLHSSSMGRRSSIGRTARSIRALSIRGPQGPTLSRANQSAVGPSSFAHGIPENYTSSPPPLTNGTSCSSPITYPSFTPMRASVSASPSLPSLNHTGPSPPAAVASPPARVDQPDLVAAAQRLRPPVRRGRLLAAPEPPPPPPPAPRDRLLHPAPAACGCVVGARAAGPAKGDESLCLWRAQDWCWWKWERWGPPRIPSDYTPTYWSDTSGLKNLGNTCYMNAPIQCLSATLPFASFRDGDLPYIIPIDFRKTVCHLNSQYNGSNQHSPQEFLSFLLDGIHEDLPARTNSGASDGKMNGLHGPKHKRGDMDRQFNRFAGTCLEDLQGEIPALCKEQHGCRYLQKKLEAALPSTGKLLEYSTDEQRNVICDSVAQDLVNILLNMHGTRTVQKMIDFLSTHRQADARYNVQIHSFIVALSLHVMVLIKDLNGNHVIQKCLNKLAPEDNQACFIIYNAVAANCIEVLLTTTAAASFSAVLIMYQTINAFCDTSRVVLRDLNHLGRALLDENRGGFDAF